MKILASPIYSRQNVAIMNKHLTTSNTPQNTCSSDIVGIVSFGHKPQPTIHKLANTTKFKKLLIESASEENLLGVGKDAYGYKVEGYPNLVLRVPRKLSPLKEEHLDNFEYVSRFQSKYNYGQTLCRSNDGIELKEFVSGKGISIQDGPFRVYLNQPIQEHEAKENYKLLQTYANFPMSSYIDLADKIKFLEKTDYVVDYFGSNNILVDIEKKEFNIIDLWEKGKFGNKGKSGFVNMVSLLCDGFMNNENEIAMKKFGYYDDYNKLMHQVIEKCRLASKIVGLPNGKQDFMTVINSAEEIFHFHLPERYNAFFEKYNL